MEQHLSTTTTKTGDCESGGEFVEFDGEGLGEAVAKREKIEKKVSDILFVVEDFYVLWTKPESAFRNRMKTPVVQLSSGVSV